MFVEDIMQQHGEARHSQPAKIRYSVKSLFGSNQKEIICGDENYVRRVEETPIAEEQFFKLLPFVKYVGVTKNFREIVDYFIPNAAGTPAGFRIEWQVTDGGRLLADLVRDIGYSAYGIKKPTNVLFSADSADPYEVGE